MSNMPTRLKHHLVLPFASALLHMRSSCCTLAAQKSAKYRDSLLMHVQSRPKGMLKTDKRDAQSLANHIYNQLDHGIQIADKSHLVRRAIPPTEAAKQLKGLMRHRYELSHESTQRKNKLIAICDELFPELTQILKDPTSPTALALREQFPTPQVLATAPLSALEAVRLRHHPSRAQLVQLQQLAN